MAQFSNAPEHFSRILNTTIAEYVKKEWENIAAKYVCLAMLKEKGRIHRQPGGTEKQWAVRFKRNPLRYLQDMPAISFQRSSKRVNAKLPMRGYWASDANTLWERAANRGPQAIIQSVSSLATELMDDFKFNINEEVFRDGNATATNKGWHGLESFLSISGARSNNAKYGEPNDNYADLSTALGVKGTWNTTTFPSGTGSTGYHYFSPLVGLYDTTAWGGGDTTWQNNSLNVFKGMGIAQDLRGYKPDLWLLNGPSYEKASVKVEAKEQIRTERSKSNSLLVKLGFGNTLNYDGVDITYERAVPASGADGHAIVGYGINFDNMDLVHWSEELVKALPVDFSIESMSERYLIYSPSNLVCNPQAFCKIRKTSGADTALI